MFVFTFFNYEQELFDRLYYDINGELHVLWGAFNRSHWLSSAVRMRNERFTVCLLFTAARHGMVLPWILLLLFNAAILRVPLFLARDALLMMTVTLPTFVSGVPATVHKGDLFLSDFDEGASQLFLIFYAPGVMCTNSLVDTVSTSCPHSVYTSFVRIKEQTAIISLYSINWLVCITEMGVKLLSLFVSFKIANRGGLLWTRQGTFGLDNKLGISWRAERLSAS